MVMVKMYPERQKSYSVNQALYIFEFSNVFFPNKYVQKNVLFTKAARDILKDKYCNGEKISSKRKIFFE